MKLLRKKYFRQIKKFEIFEKHARYIQYEYYGLNHRKNILEEQWAREIGYPLKNLTLVFIENITYKL